MRCGRRTPQTPSATSQRKHAGIQSLNARDIAVFDVLRIPKELLAEAGVERVTDEGARGYGYSGSGDYSGIFFPYISPETERRNTGRLRRDNPEMENGKPKDKYRSPYGDSRHLYFPPRSKSLLTDVATVVVIVEAEKSALAVTAWMRRIGRSVLAVATGGCWGWKGTIGKTTSPNGARVAEKGALSDLALISWSEREAIVVFDSNVATNPQVQAAERELIGELRRRGAHVRVARIPPEDGVNGPDDLIGRSGDVSFTAVLDQARAPIAALDVPPGQVLDDCRLSSEALASLADVTVLEPRLRELQQALRDCDRVRRTVIREALLDRLSAAKVRGAAKLVDAALSGDVREADTGRAPAFADDEPWPDAVDGALLLDALVRRLSVHLVMPSHAAEGIALWVVHSYLMDIWQISPLLVFTSPTKQCGKSTALMLVSSLCPRQAPASSLTPAVLFRIVDQYRPTLAIDEADTLLRDNHELRAVINTSYIRATARVPRCVGDKHEPRFFSSWGAKIVALIGRLPDMTASRSILISMQRKMPGDRVARLRADRLEVEAVVLRRKATRWARDSAPRLRDADPDLPVALDARAADNWRPLVAIADAAGGHWPETARSAARALSGLSRADDAEASVLVLGDIQRWFAQQGSTSTFVESTTLVSHLVALEARPWAEWSRGRPLSAVGLSRLLRDYGISPRKVRRGNRTANGYERDAFADAWSRYLPASEPEHRNTLMPPGRKEGYDLEQVSSDVPTRTDEMSLESRLCSGVPAQNPCEDEELRI